MRKYIFFGVLVIVVILSGYRLKETPPTWMDEGVITQVARNLALNNRHAVQIAPGEYATGSFISTAYPTTFPVSISFRLFGVGILEARIIMMLFIITLFCAVYLYFRPNTFEKKSELFLLAVLLLLATFAPLYGHGKNVLGEIPGMAYLFLSFVFLQKAYGNSTKKSHYILFGLFLGLAIVTKPIFILIAPAALITWFLYRKKIFETPRIKSIVVVSCAVPILVWLAIQFQGDSLEKIMSLYTNPNANSDMVATVVGNIKRFFAEAQPVYTMILFLVWTVTGIIRYRKGKSIAPAETIAWIFSLLILGSFLRTAGFYRYFFEAELLALVFFVGSVKDVVTEKYHKFVLIGLALLICLQSYQTFFNSWVSTHAEGTRSALLEEKIGSINPAQSIFFYQVPEAVNFLKPEHKNYYQYLAITTALSVGDSALDTFKEKPTDLVVTSSQMSTLPLFSKYTKKDEFNSYVIFSK